MNRFRRIASLRAVYSRREATFILLVSHLILMAGCISFSPPLFPFAHFLPDIRVPATPPTKSPTKPPINPTVKPVREVELGEASQLAEVAVPQVATAPLTNPADSFAEEASLKPSFAESLPTIQDNSQVTIAAATIAAIAPQSDSSDSYDRVPPTANPGAKLVIEGVRPERGPVKVAVYTSPNAFPNPSSASQTFDLPSSNPTIETTLMTQGTIAVGVFQDINSDGQLNRNRFGIPTEPFAFSNNASGQRGPPAFEQAAVMLPSESKSGNQAPFVVLVKLP